MRTMMLMAAALVAAPATGQTVKAGIEAWSRADYSGALAAWRPLAAKGNPDALFNMAQAYRLGRGVPIDLGRAEDLYTRAARLGHVDAQTELGRLLFQAGYPRAAVSWLKRAADKGDARAQLLYGTALYNGDGVARRDPLLAYSYVARAAAQGLGPAKSTLADMDREIPAHLRQVALAGGALAQPVASPQPVTTPSRTGLPPLPSARPVAVTGGAAARGGWRIQLGAFAQKSGADALFRKFAAGPLAGRQSFLVPAGAVTRLQVGPFASRADAAAACAALAARGQPCFVVPPAR